MELGSENLIKSVKFAAIYIKVRAEGQTTAGNQSKSYSFERPAANTLAASFRTCKQNRGGEYCFANSLLHCK